jgi:putative membrane protein insertion efficiency factor
MTDVSPVLSVAPGRSAGFSDGLIRLVTSGVAVPLGARTGAGVRVGSGDGDVRVFGGTGLVRVIHWYQRLISPLRRPRCKYYPSCSHYAVTALGRWGLLRGGVLGLWRLLRCNPWSAGGVDYVPGRLGEVDQTPVEAGLSVGGARAGAAAAMARGAKPTPGAATVPAGAGVLATTTVEITAVHTGVQRSGTLGPLFRAGEKVSHGLV